MGYNVTSGDTGSINVGFEVVDLVWQIAVIGGLVSFFVVFIVLGIYFGRNENYHMVYSYLFFLFGMIFLMVTSYVMNVIVVTYTTDAGLINLMGSVYRGVLWVTMFIMALTILSFVKSALINPFIEKRKDRGMWEYER
tara:strand:+ start:1815 stop:2228 length:414 start_codon:yes stop_codon:yes gene_type:complete